MGTKKPKIISQRRKSKTDYRKRLRLLESNKPRLVVRKQSNTVIAQLVNYFPEGDKVTLCITSNHLEKEGWKHGRKNLPSCYLIGLLIGKKAVTKKIKEVVLDTGLIKPSKGSRLYAVLKGALDSGLQIPHSDTILPAEGRINGKHIGEYKKLDDYQKEFEAFKSKILGK